VYAAEASDKNDLLEKILPSTVSEYIELVRAHTNAGEHMFIWITLIHTKTVLYILK